MRHRDTLQPERTGTPGRPTHRRSAIVFFGFAIIIAIDIVLAGMFNPDRGEAEFWIKLILVFGGLLLWAAWIGWRLWGGAGVVAAYGFLGLVTASALLGAVIQIAIGAPSTPPFPGMRMLLAARLVSAVYVLVAWLVLV